MINGYNTFAADEAVHRGCSIGDLFCVGAAVGRMGEYRVIQLFWKKGARLSQRGFDGATPDEVAKARTMFKEMDDAVKSGRGAVKRAFENLEDQLEE
ncbi:hypothetical protein C0Q70_00063 [Pomacea canaliculata]|uniref:Uncharacterized protein n=1 Tax=Pomacea canaliculata TaxID=400727 RepID=A0A2T7PVM8_POMCA|nr:hypothetical protein C0Q70_00063 [Pomacea canaliculata]